MNPTPEQEDAIDLFLAELGLAIEAGAGTGKTTTLQMMGRATQRRGQYVAFNTSIVNEAQRKMPRNVAAATMHSLAMRSTGRTLRHRLDSGRMRSSQIALLLDTRHFTVKYGAQTKVLQPSYLGSLTMRAIARFCQSADPEPLPIHVPYVHGIDVPTNDGPGWENNDRLREVLAPALKAAWRDLVDPGGKLPFRHDHYLKLWQLSEPRIAADFILFDEAQDASPVMLAIVAAQTDSQLVFVGDSQQQIYAWRGAVNALQAVPGDARTFLTHSFRFGPEIAEVANIILARLNADLRLVGRGGDSVVAHVVDPKCILTRTNAASVNALLVEQGVPVMHPDLACFESWLEVLDYCLAPGTRVLADDLTWRYIETVDLGDRLVGFDEEAGPGASGRCYRTAVVESVKRHVLPCWRITMEDGTTVTASTDHRWLTKTTKNNLRWQRTDALHPGSQIASVGPRWDVEDSRDAGWLAGMFDGEGWMTRPKKGTARIGVSQNEGVVLDRIRWALKERQFEVAERAYVSCRQLVLTGGLSEKLRFLGTIRPHRLLAHASDCWEGNRVEARVRSTVRSVEYVGEQEVVAVGTSTRTFIAEGLLSHNCQQDPQGDELRLLVDLIEEFGVDAIVRALDPVKMPLEPDADVVVSTVHKAKGREWDSVRLASDFADPNERDDNAAEEWRLLYVAATRARSALDVDDCGPVRDLLARPTQPQPQEV